MEPPDLLASLWAAQRSRCYCLRERLADTVDSSTVAKRLSSMEDSWPAMPS